MLPIDFRELPKSPDGFSRLFYDFIYDFPKVKKYYAGDFRSLGNLPEYLDGVQKGQEHRNEIVEILIKQNTEFNCAPETLQNIEELRKEGTFCVVTGQQLGILGGPLYTFYKAITTVKLVKHLNTLHAPLRFVPLFWLEGEDHDLEEVNSITLLSSENTPTVLEYFDDPKFLEKNRSPVGELVLDSSLDAFLLRLEKALQQSEFRAQVLEAIGAAYSRGRTFKEAFVRWLRYLLSETGDGASDPGLIFFSSNDPRAKRLLSPIFIREIQEHPCTSQLVISQSAELEKEYHAQIKPKAINLFMFAKGGRYLIEPRENDFSLKGTRSFHSKDELLRIAAEQPELLSPNVVLRTICQDALFPTAAYVAGPSEIAYFAQLRPVYEHFAVSMPIIYPRVSVTIVEQKLLKVLEKYQLELSDFFGRRESLRAKVVDLLSEVDLNELFEGGKKQLNELLNELKFGLNYIDPTLLGALDTAREKIEAQLAALHGKARAAQERRHEIALKQIDKVLNNILPNGMLQERALNIVNYMNKYGMDFPRWLNDEIRLDVFNHQMIER